MARVEIAVTAWRTGKTWDASSFCRQAEQAEALGFHSWWLPENHFGPQQAIPSPLTLLAAAAARTSTLKLGTTSYLLPIRHPIQAAEEVAVVDQLSEGRLILGLGRGIQAEVFKAFGVAEKDKRNRFEENLAIMQRAWRGEAILENQDGEPVCLSPLPAREGGPPLWVAAFGPKALRQVGTLGLPYLASPVETLQQLESNRELHALACSEAGHTGVSVNPVMRCIHITEDAHERERLKQSLAKSIPPKFRREDASVDDWAIIGDRHFASDKLAEYSERLGITHLIGGGRMPAIAENDILDSHSQLLDIGASL